MSTKQHVVLYTFAAAVLVAFTLSLPLAAQQSPQHIGIVDDWSTHHLGFSNPGSFQDAEANGTVDRWLRIVNDPRYQMQRMKQMRQNTALELSDPAAQESAVTPGAAGKTVPPPPKPIHQDWSMNLGSGATVGAGQYPAKFSFDTTHASCDSDTFPDFVVYNTGKAGAAAQPTIIAYDNLYSGCTGSVPSVYWQYNTGTNSIAPTSVSVSLDGSQVAFIQRDSSNHASLVVLKWLKSGTIATLTSNGSYPSCAAPCMIVVPLSGTPNVTRSAAYVDYLNGFLYVGDDIGKLHKFANVFTGGTPAEITSGWPITVAASGSTVLSGPVYDSASGNVLVGSGNPVGNSGNTNVFFYRVPAAGGTVTASSTLGVGMGVVDAPLVDSGAARAYVAIGSTGTGNCNGNDCKSVIYQFTTTFASGNGGSAQNLGIGDNSTVVYDGAFDNIYWNSPDQTGSLYVCSDRAPSLYRVPITTNSIQPETQGPALTTANAGCSPVTEFFNNGTDRIFLSVAASAKTVAPIGCPAAAGCVMSFDVTTTTGFGTSKTTSAVAQEAGGTSAIVIDNAVSSPAGTSQVYFSTRADQTCTTSGGTGGCAIQASQAALQ